MKGRYFLILYLCALFVYVFIKAWLIPFTHDECQSYTIFAEHSSQGNTANNHWLNTWSAYLFYLIFGQNELAMRMPNILAFVLYLFYAYKFSQKFDNFIVQSVCVILLTAFPFLLDFFSMMRGYGLSMGFGLAGVYHLTALAENKNDKKNLEASLYISLLAVLSNFSMLFFHFALLGVTGLLLLQRYGIGLFAQNFKKLLIRPVIVNIVVLSAAIYWVLFLKSRNQLYSGSDIDLFFGTFQSLVMVFFYRENMLPGESFMPWVRACSVLFLALITLGFWHRKTNPGFFSLSLLALITCVIPIVLHYTLGLKYPLDRTALYFYMLLMLLISFGMQAIKSLQGSGIILKGIAAVILLAWLGNFAVHTSFSTFCFWKYDSHTRDAVAMMRKENDSVRITCHWLAEPSVNFYIKKMNIRARKVTKTEKVKGETFDFYYIFPGEVHLLPPQKNVLLQMFPASGMRLYTRKD